MMHGPANVKVGQRFLMGTCAAVGLCEKELGLRSALYLKFEAKGPIGQSGMRCFNWVLEDIAGSRYCDSLRASCTRSCAVIWNGCLVDTGTATNHKPLTYSRNPPHVTHLQCSLPYQ